MLRAGTATRSCSGIPATTRPPSVRLSIGSGRKPAVISAIPGSPLPVPATSHRLAPAEILAAKFLFYPMLGLALSALLAGIYRPAVLGHAFFWLCMGAIAIGYLGVGQTIASLARTQRRASLGALCYFLAVALLLLI